MNWITKTISLALVTLTIPTIIFAQEKVNWDDHSTASWPSSTQLIEIKSTADQKIQKSYLYKSNSSAPQPLIISLHTWGGNYAQRDPLLKYCIEADLNYLHPDFRGPNNNPNAAGSSLVVQDIDDAIQWAIDSLKVDLNNIHIVGVSGGGFATVMGYMKSKHNIKSFHAFVGIYNLENWYYESLGRKNNYGKDIIAITQGTNEIPKFDEAHKRSPLLMQTPTKQRTNSKLYLYAGLHDGYIGSVPISHSLEMYNKVVNDFNKKEKNSLIPEKDMYTLLKRRTSPNFEVIKNAFMQRDIIYQKQYKDLVEIVIFDGGHEMPDDNILPRVLK